MPPAFRSTAGAGFPVSANNPQTVEKQSVGRLWNVKWDDNKLKGEVWIDVEKAKRISLDVLAMVQGQRKLEISTGLWFEPEPSSGKWNGEAYNAIARNIRPDHLALLPYGHGACSWDDGCGVRVNQTIRPGEMDETPLIIPQLNFNRRF